MRRAAKRLWIFWASIGIALGVFCLPLAVHHRDIRFAGLGLLAIAFFSAFVVVLRRMITIEDWEKRQ